MIRKIVKLFLLLCLFPSFAFAARTSRVSSSSSSSGGGSSIYNSTSTAGFPFGFTAGSITVSGINAGGFDASYGYDLQVPVSGEIRLGHGADYFDVFGSAVGIYSNGALIANFLGGDISFPNLDCSANLNGGKLTAGVGGAVGCADDISSAGGGDNLGNHIATMTLTALFGVNASTGIFTSTGTQNAVKIVANGTYGVTAGTAGGLLVDCTGGGSASGMCAQFYTNASTQTALGGIANIIQALAQDTWNEPGLYIKMASTNGGAANIRLDGPVPQIEWVENDQVSPAGKYEDGVNGDIRYIAGRKADNSGFENFIEFARPDLSGGGYVNIVSSRTPVRFSDGAGTHYVSFRGSGTVASNVNFVWPNADGTANQALVTNGAGNLFFLSVATGVVAPLTFSNGILGVDGSSITLLGPSIAMGTETTGVYVSSLTGFGAISIAGSNNAASAAPILVLDTSTANGVLIISSATTNFMTQSSSTANDLKLSSAAATYLNKLVVYLSSATGGASISVAGTNNIAGGAPIFNVNQTSVPVLNASGKLYNFQHDASSVTMQGPVVSSITAVNQIPGTYTLATITINPQGQVTAASNGTGGAGDMLLASTQTASAGKTWGSFSIFNGSLTINKGLFLNSVVAASNYICTTTDTVVFASGTTVGAGAQRIITLPAVATSSGQVLCIIKTDISTAAVVIRTNAQTELIAGATTQVYMYAPGQRYTLLSDGVFWQPRDFAITPNQLGISQDPNSTAVVVASTVYCSSVMVPDFVGITAIVINVSAQALQTAGAIYQGGVLVSTTSKLTLGTGKQTLALNKVAYVTPGPAWVCFGPESATTSITRKSASTAVLGTCAFATSLPFPTSLTFEGCTAAPNDFAFAALVGGGIR